MTLRHIPRGYKLITLSFLTLVLSPLAFSADTATISIPQGTPLPVQAEQHYPMKAGTKIEARLLYPVYAENHVVIPSGTLLRGSVVQLDRDQHRRNRSRLDGDFTPFHTPVVRFDQLLLPDGSAQPITSSTSGNGAPILRLAAPGANAKNSSLISRELSQAKQQAKDSIAMLTAPDKGDRILQLMYHQLPYHPERIEKGTAWTVELTEPLTLKKDAFPEQRADREKAIEGSQHPETSGTAPEVQNGRNEWLLDAYLKQTVSSATAKQGQEVQAVVAKPILNPDHSIAIPQGATLIGTVTRAQSARSLARPGKLRFDFREIKLPDGSAQHVEGLLAAAASDTRSNLQMNAEGEVQPKQQDRIIMPLALSLLATRAFDSDGNAAANGAASSNGFGLIGRALGTAAGSRNFAAGIGFYGAALSVYDRWLTHGKEVVFAKDTRVEILTTPIKSSVLSTTKESH